jgi:hypothetical protein
MKYIVAVTITYFNHVEAAILYMYPNCNLLAIDI